MTVAGQTQAATLLLGNPEESAPVGEKREVGLHHTIFCPGLCWTCLKMQFVHALWRPRCCVPAHEQITGCTGANELGEPVLPVPPCPAPAPPPRQAKTLGR
jgi:hypothetical protein